MVEVFKTNVSDADQAKQLVAKIHKSFENYRANFDLEDCDLILRVENVSGPIQAFAIISLMEENGWSAAVLEDTLSFFTT